MLRWRCTYPLWVFLSPRCVLGNNVTWDMMRHHAIQTVFNGCEGTDSVEGCQTDNLYPSTHAVQFASSALTTR